MQHLIIVVAFDQHSIETADHFAQPAKNVPQVGEDAKSLTALQISTTKQTPSTAS